VTMPSVCGCYEDTGGFHPCQQHSGASVPLPMQVVSPVPTITLSPSSAPPRGGETLAALREYVTVEPGSVRQDSPVAVAYVALATEVLNATEHLAASRAAPGGEGEEVTRLKAVIERQRTLAVEWGARFRESLNGYAWLEIGRGPYEWDDDEFHKEFGRARANLLGALDRMERDLKGRDFTDCPTTQAEVEAARALLARSAAGRVTEEMVERFAKAEWEDTRRAWQSTTGESSAVTWEEMDDEHRLPRLNRMERILTAALAPEGR